MANSHVFELDDERGVPSALGPALVVVIGPHSGDQHAPDFVLAGPSMTRGLPPQEPSRYGPGAVADCDDVRAQRGQG